MDLRYYAYFLALTATLGGCTASDSVSVALLDAPENPAPHSWSTVTATAHDLIAPPAEPGPDCPPLAPGLRAEAARYTPIDADWQRSLILSEIAKNRALTEAMAAYERCRKLSRG